MKAIAVCILIYLVFFTNSFSFLNFDTWQFPLWIADMSWVGVELVSVLIAIVAVAAIAALVTLGLIGAAAVAVIGTVLALLFGSVMIAWPLLFIAVLCWLVADNKKVVC